MPPFLGEKKAKKFSASLDKLITALSEDVSIKDIGKMSVRGGYEALRVIVVSAEPCFFLLRALLNSDDEKKNLERIIRKGCTAGETTFA